MGDNGEKTPPGTTESGDDGDDVAGTSESPDAGDEGGDDDVAEMYGSPDAGEDGGDEGGDGYGANLDMDSPLLSGDAPDEMEEVTGRFYVKHTEDVAVTLHEIGTEGIYTLVENPGLEVHQILDATLVENPPLGVSYLIEEIHEQRTIPVEYSDEPPTRQVQQLATDMEHDQAAAIEREGEGEIHIIHVAPEDVAETAESLDDDETTYKNAAEFGVERVEIRTDEDAGIVSIRYLP
ncbi:hypothetical protein BRC69_07865 [Halobacteriales archaeon QH_6_66_25]|nr:MAG: hypothetical protein BRC69_07865 [Halobacteriales archaeon QH_6_66_25]